MLPCHEAQAQLNNFTLVKKKTKKQWNGNKSSFEEAVTENHSQHLPKFKNSTGLHRVSLELTHFNDCTNCYVVPPLISLPVLAPALTHLSEKMTKITMSHASNTVALNSIVLERESVDKREREMRNVIEIAEEKRAWFDDFKQWVEGVAGFLDEKVNFEPLSLRLVLTCYLVSKTREA